MTRIGVWSVQAFPCMTVYLRFPCQILLSIHSNFLVKHMLIIYASLSSVRCVCITLQEGTLTKVRCMHTVLARPCIYTSMCVREVYVWRDVQCTPCLVSCIHALVRYKLPEL